MGLGLCLLAATESTILHRLALGAFVIFSFCALPLGLRGEVFFPLLAAAVVRTKWRKPPSAWITIGAVIVLLFSIAVISDVRQVGLGSASMASGHPLDGLTEMGQSLRPVSEVVYWHKTGDEFLNGATYWAPLDRGFCRIIPSAKCLPAEEDERITGTLVMNRVGPIGFSPIAEAYLNFGRTGVVFVMFAIGVLIGSMDKWPVTRARLAAFGVIYVELLINIRNSFIALPSHIIVGFILVYVVVIWSESAYKRAKRQRIRL
jgi:hypothetical protein